MAQTWHVRIKCTDGEGNYHYHQEDQVDTIDDTIECPTHPTNTASEFCIEGYNIT